jgi:superkiller protein 3
LEKDRNRRYETANGFAADVRRYLDDEPVQACPPSAWYRFRKFARRNKRAMATATLLSVMLLTAVGAVAGSLGWVVHDRAGRMADIEREVTLALDEANRHQEQRHWAEALSAAKRGDSLLAGEGSEELRRKVRELRRDLEMVIRLEKIRDEVLTGAKPEVEYKDESMFDVELADREYSRAFAEYGIDIDALPVEEAVHRLRARSVVTELAAALDSWALARSSLGKGDNRWKGLLAVAKAADPDEWRGRLRDAWEHKDLAALKALSVSEQVNRLPAQTLYLLGSVLREVGDVEGAVVFLRKAQQLYPDDFWINVQLALYYSWDIKPQQRDEVMRYATAANAIRKQSAVPYRYLGLFLMERGQLDEAITANKEAIRLKPNYWAAYYNLGVALSRKGQLDEAVTAYREAGRLFPGWSWPHGALGNVLQEKGKLDEAIVCYKKAIELDPKFVSAHTNLGSVFQVQKKLDEAIACDRKAIELDPKCVHAHNGLGNALRAQGKLDEAIACYRKAIELDPKYVHAHINLGHALKDQGKLEEAVVTHRKAVEVDPKDPATHNNLGVALSDKGQQDEAITAYHKAIELDPKAAAPHNNLGSALARQGKVDKAITAYRKAIELNPKYAKAHGNLGSALKKQGKLDEAIAAYHKAIELDPTDAATHNNLGSALGDKGQQDEAIAAYHKAIELDPKNTEAYNNLAWLLATCPDPKFRDPKRAVELAKNAVQQAPTRGDFWNTLGIARYRAGEWKDGMDALKTSDELLKGEAFAFNAFFLAMAHWQLGEKEEARKTFDQAAQWMEKNKPEDVELKRFREEAAELLGVKDK